MRSLMLHAPAAYIASVCTFGYGLQSLTHLTHAVEMFNVCVAPADKISLDSLASSNIGVRSEFSRGGGQNQTRGKVREGDVPPPARSAKAFSALIY